MIFMYEYHITTLLRYPCMEPAFEEHWAQAWLLLMKQVKCITGVRYSGYLCNAICEHRGSNEDVENIERET